MTRHLHPGNCEVIYIRIMKCDKYEQGLLFLYQIVYIAELLFFRHRRKIQWERVLGSSTFTRLSLGQDGHRL